MVQLNIEQSLMRGALGPAYDASSCTYQVKATASGLKRKRDTQDKTKESEESDVIFMDPDHKRKQSIMSAMSLYTEDELAGIDLIVADDFWFGDPPAMTIDAEAVAFQWLQKRRVTYAQLMQLLDLLPAAPCTRHISEHLDHRDTQKAIHFGAFVHGPMTGIRVTTRRYPWVCRLLNCIVHSLTEDNIHSNVFLSLNVPMGIHSDANNMAGIQNTLIPLSRFDGGQLYVCDPAGDHRLEHGGLIGNIIPITLPFSRFNPHKKHLILPWAGNRLVLGTYHIRNADMLSGSSREFLTHLGFNISCEGVATEDPYMTA